MSLFMIINVDTNMGMNKDTVRNRERTGIGGIDTDRDRDTDATEMGTRIWTGPKTGAGTWAPSHT